jgi:hypothetical protein
LLDEVVAEHADSMMEKMINMNMPHLLICSVPSIV